MLNKLIKKLKYKHSQNKATQSTVEIPSNWHVPLTAKELLDTLLRQQYLTTIWQNVSMSPKMFETLYQASINRYVEMVQLLPASESHHHSHLGGMIDHGLEVIAIASKLRQSYVLPQNAAPEDQAKQRDVWTAVVIYAALIHDIGKVATDLEIVLLDGSRWFPWQGVPKQPYNFRYIKGRDYNLHPALGGFFAGQLIPQEAFGWIAPFPEAFSQLMYFAANHTDKAGVLGEIVQKADQYSVTVALGGEPTKVAEKPKASFAKQLHIALQEVIKGYKLNTTRGGGQAWLTDTGLWVMSKTTADSIRAYLAGQGISAPSKNGAMFDELIAHNLVEATSEKAAIWDVKVSAKSIRRRQLLNLRLADIDLDKRVMVLQPEYNKNHDYHIIPIAEKLIPELTFLIAEHKKRKSKEDAQLFNMNLFCQVTRRKGKRMSDDQLSHLFRVLSKQIFCAISPHRFRHTTATMLMKNKAENLYNVQKLLGHKDIKTTLGYIEYDPEIIRDCINSL